MNAEIAYLDYRRFNRHAHRLGTLLVGQSLTPLSALPRKPKARIHSECRPLEAKPVKLYSPGCSVLRALALNNTRLLFR